MATLKPKEFIQQVLIDELKPIIISSPYISFALMAIGIEFLGKCLDTTTVEWNTERRSRMNFTDAIKNLLAFRRYLGYEEGLFEDLRCGFAHSFVPGTRFTLSSKGQCYHMFDFGTRVNLRCEDFYEDFKAACLEVIGMTFPPADKMNRDFLDVPGASFSDYSPPNASTLVNADLSSSTSGGTKVN
jgi:hypothetical protein